MAAREPAGSRLTTRESIAWLLVIGAAIAIPVLMSRRGPEVSPRSEQSSGPNADDAERQRLTSAGSPTTPRPGPGGWHLQPTRAVPTTQPVPASALQPEAIDATSGQDVGAPGSSRQRSARDVPPSIPEIVLVQEFARFLPALTTKVQLPAEVTGEVLLRGSAPTMREIDPWADPKCQLRSHATEEDVLVHDGKLENVFVRVVRPNAEAARSLLYNRRARPLINPRMREAGCAFSPRMSQSLPGSTMLFVNEDNTSHDLTATLDGRVVLHAVQPPRSSDVELPLAAAGIIELRSANQPWMKAFVVVGDDLRHSDVTTSSGRFRLGRLGVGTYTIEAWHERYGWKRQELVVKPGDVPFVQFIFDAEPQQHQSQNP